ncbi:MAG: CHAT domain-containing protein, partial [Roseiflexaceae bacterium]|nr:CHAT domain-containing protein [Roseiflexaceae bacterium]
MAPTESSQEVANASLRMLVLIAAPLIYQGRAIPPLAVTEEIESITAACRRLDGQSPALTIRVEVATTATLGEVFATASAPYDLLHFTGHGSVTTAGTVLMLEDDREPGAARPLDAMALRELLGHKPCRLALLSACHSEGLAQTLLDLGVEHVVVVSADDAVLDRAARTFAARFYQTLLAAQSVQEAFERAVVAVRHDDLLRKVPDPTTFEPVNLAEAAKFRLLPDNPERHAQPLVATVPVGEVVLRRPPWSERTNLSPLPSDPFVGRQTEMHAVHMALRDARCIVVHGLGGMGKTALAEAVGRWQHERARWSDGVYLIELRNLDTASTARQRIALALGITETSAVESDASLALALRDRQILLILDDLDVLRERDKDGLVALLKALLGTRSLRLLVTTRRPLPGEVVARPIPLNRLGPRDALRAFGEYAPPDTWGAAYQPQIMQALQQVLDGYPFPIRLAATFMVQTACGVAGLLGELRADPLGTFRYPGDEEDRNSSLAATLVLSYRALPEAAKSMLPILALFPAGLSRAAAEAILGAAAFATVRTLHLYALAEQRNDQGYQRYALPEPARRYAEALGPQGLLEAHAPAALAFYAALIDGCNELIAAQGQIVAGRTLLLLEQPNWRWFLEWGFAHEQEEGQSSSARAAGSLGNYWTVIGEKGKQETLDLLRKAHTSAQRLRDRQGEANVLQAIGDVQQFRKQTDAALASYQQALGLFREIG